MSEADGASAMIYVLTERGDGDYGLRSAHATWVGAVEAVAACDYLGPRERDQWMVLGQDARGPTSWLHTCGYHKIEAIDLLR